MARKRGLLGKMVGGVRASPTPRSSCPAGRARAGLLWRGWSLAKDRVGLSPAPSNDDLDSPVTGWEKGCCSPRAGGEGDGPAEGATSPRAIARARPPDGRLCRPARPGEPRQGDAGRWLSRGQGPGLGLSTAAVSRQPPETAARSLPPAMPVRPQP